MQKLAAGERTIDFLNHFSVVPVVKLALGSSLNPEDIEEGDDVYFECKVNANPIAYKVVWKHNVRILMTFITRGMRKIVLISTFPISYFKLLP